MTSNREKRNMADAQRNNNMTFDIPHAFEDMFGNAYALQEKYFYVMLCKLSSRYADENGMFFCADMGRKEHGIHHGFSTYGFTSGICKSARKKLIADGLLECRYIHGFKGYRIGIAYRLLDEKLISTSRAIYDSILNHKLDGSQSSIPIGDLRGQNVHITP